MITNYNILQSHSLTELPELVRKEIAKGWEPFGTVICLKTGGTITRTTFAQPMVKRLSGNQNLSLD